MCVAVSKIPLPLVGENAPLFALDKGHCVLTWEYLEGISYPMGKLSLSDERIAQENILGCHESGNNIEFKHSPQKNTLCCPGHS